MIDRVPNHNKLLAIPQFTMVVKNIIKWNNDNWCVMYGKRIRNILLMEFVVIVAIN